MFIATYISICLLIHDFSEAITAFSVSFHVFPVPRRSPLSSIPCFFQQTTLKNTQIKFEKSKSETQVILPPSLRIAQRLIRQFHRHKPFLFLTLSPLPHLCVLLPALIRMQSQRQSLVRLSNVPLGGRSIHAQHRVQVSLHRLHPRLPSAALRVRNDRCRSK